VPEGADVSEHQGLLPADWFAQFDFVIIRAFNENGYPDKQFTRNWDNARGRTLRGAYGWPIPGEDNRAIGQMLVDFAPGAEFGYWADVEHSRRGLASAADVEQYLLGIGPHLRGFYSNPSELPRSVLLDQENWWVAAYGPNDGQRHDRAFPREWVIYQYTSAGGLDRNYAPSLIWAGGGRVATGQELIDAALRFLGQPYSTAPGRDDPNGGHKDCSGLIAAAYLVATGQPLGANVSVTIFDLAAKQGLEISREEAFATPGACLLMPEDPYQGWGPAGHIGFSTGDGFTVEATPPRVQRLPNTHQPWGTRACLLPGIDYGRDDDMTSEESKKLTQAFELSRYAYWGLSRLVGAAPPVDHPIPEGVEFDFSKGPLGAIERKLDALAGQPVDGELVEGGPVALSDADVDRIAASVADKLAKRLKD
jgi:cell wall-associated NlpC family hydrolase